MINLDTVLLLTVTGVDAVVQGHSEHELCEWHHGWLLDGQPFLGPSPAN